MNIFIAGILLIAFFTFFYGKNDSEGKIWSDNKEVKKKMPYKFHYYWTHFVGQITGWVMLYFLLIKQFMALDWNHAVFLIIALLGITGYLPRLLWFTTLRKNDE